MNVLFWMSNGFDTPFTSEHLLGAVIYSLAMEGHNVHVIQTKQGGKNPELPEYLRIPNITTSSIPYSAPLKSNFIKRYISEIKWHLSCKKELERHRDYDALFLQSTTVAGFAIGLARRVLGSQCIITFNVQDIFPYNAEFSGNVKKDGLVFKVMAAEQRYGYKRADHIITISEDMKDTLVTDGIPGEKIEVVYNWSYQDELYENLDLTPVFHMFDKNYFNVVYAGNIGVMQNVDILIEAARLMMDDNDVWFHIIGNGVYKDKLAARAKEYGITNISFWPMQPPEFAPLIYKAADINVIPLVKDVYKTALPSKTATCIACQKPIIFAIGRDSKFGQEVMNETGCPVVESNDPEDLVETIVKRINSVDEDRFRAYFKSKMSKTVNSKRYASIITKSIML